MNNGDRVRVHFNLHTGLWSVTARSGPRRGRVIANLASVAISDCRFIVSEPSRQRVLAKRQRAVHAWVEGCATPVGKGPVNAVGFTYNPYRAGTFTRRDTGAPVTTAGKCWFIGNQAFMEEHEL